MKTNRVKVFKLFAIVLSVLLVFGAFPVSALDADGYTENETTAVDTTPEETTEEPEAPTEFVTDEQEEIVPGLEEENIPGEDDLAATGDDNPNPDIEPTEAPTEPPMNLSDGFYLIGPAEGESDDTGWAVTGIRPSQKFSTNPKNSDEMMLYTTLEKGRKIKVVKVVDGAIPSVGGDGKDESGEFVWYPNGNGGEYTVDESHAGEVVIFFRKTQNNDWSAFGGYIYIAKEVKESEESDPVPVVKDETVPTLTLEGYAKANDKGELADWTNEDGNWASASDKIYAKLTAKDNDGGFGINDNSFMIQNSKGKYSNGNAIHKDGKYYVRLTERDKLKITVKDNAGNTSDAVDTAKMNIDTVAPTSEDIESVTFKRHSENNFWSVLTFGLYSKDNGVDVTVAVKPNDGSPIKKIELKDGNTPITADEVDNDGNNAKKVEGKNLYEATFNLQDKETAYDLKIANIIDGVGLELKDAPVDVLSCDLFAEDTSITSLYEVAVVSEKVLPSIEVKDGSISPAPVNEVYSTTLLNPLTMTAAYKEVITGLQESSIKAYFGSSSDLAAGGDGSYDLSKATAIDLTAAEKSDDWGEGNLAGKLRGREVTFSVPQQLAEDTDTYRLVLTAESNAGRSYTKAVDFNIDNTPPSIDSHSVVYVEGENETPLADGEWTNKPTRVKLTVTDAGKAFEKGVASIKVVGTASGELSADAVQPVEGEEDTYYFDVDCHEGFTVTATDGYGHESEPLVIAPEEVRFDNEIPVIGDVLYDGKSYEDSLWKQGGVTVSFNVTDKSAIEKIKDTWLSGKADTTVKIVDESGETFKGTVERSEFSEDTGYTFSFISDSFMKYTVTATDKAGNESESAEVQPTKVDKEAPYFTSFAIAPKAENSILNILTFGLYSNNNLEITVNAADNAPSSGIVAITAKYGNNDLTPTTDDLTTSGENVDENGKATASRTFEIPLSNSAAYNPALLSFTVVDGSILDESNPDEAGRKLTATLSELDTDAAVDDNTDPAKVPYEIVVNNIKPTVEDFTFSPAPDYDGDGKKWYNGAANVEVTTTVNKAPDVDLRLSHLHTVEVKLNNNDVSAASNADQYTFYGEDTEANQKIDSVDVAMNIRSVDDAFVNRASSGKTKNTVKVYAESNNGENNYDDPKTDTFYIDDVAPQVTKFTFDGKDIKANDDVVKTDYGYFFQDDVEVRVYVTDTVDGVAGSGVQSVTYRADSVSDQFGSKGIGEQTVSSDEFVNDGDDTYYIEFTVYAGFKGNIFASAVDNVNNAGHVYSADGTIVESEKEHAAASSIDITIASTPVGKDNQGIDLYNGSVAVDLQISDLYSGLKDVSYRIIDTDHPEDSTPFITQDIYKDGEGDWTVNARDRNLICTVSKRITVDSSEHNDNNVRIQLKGTDNAGFEIKQIEKAISIDITPPEIKVEYSLDRETANHVGENYYFKDNRTATITVIERNFNPNDFDLSKYVALEGSRPALVGGAKWSTDYDYERGGNGNNEQTTATHKATITFAEDGKFDVDFDFTDLAGHAAKKSFEREIFYIDKTKPTMTVEIVSEASAANGNYYNKTVTARITIVEHNFSADAPYFVYTGEATAADNHTSATPPSVSNWTSEGDTHHATITFSADGMYSFKITFQDLAKNLGEDFSQSTFYVDQTINAPVITGVQNTHAYSGEVIPVIDYEDYNFDYANGYSYVLKKHWFDLDKMEQSVENAKYPASENRKNTGTGLIVNYQNFERSELTEGVYELKAHIKDLANNEADSDTVIFSVNRYGSVFVLGSTNTVSLLDKGYTADAPDVAIKEINVNRAKQQKVSLSHDSASKELTEGKDYTIKHSGGATSWYETLYVVNADNFADDGEYGVTVTSVDTFDNTVTNMTANTESGHKRNCPVNFVVDKQDPEVKISGVDEDGYYSEAEKVLHIVCIDENIDKESLAVKLDDQPYEVPAEYVDMDLVGEIEINLPITAQNGETKHKIEVAVQDKANNAGDDRINAFTLSATFLTMFFHNTVALIISGAVLAGLIALAVVLIMKKRKSAK